MSKFEFVDTPYRRAKVTHLKDPGKQRSACGKKGPWQVTLEPCAKICARCKSRSKLHEEGL